MPVHQSGSEECFGFYHEKLIAFKLCKCEGSAELNPVKVGKSDFKCFGELKLMYFPNRKNAWNRRRSRRRDGV